MNTFWKLSALALSVGLVTGAVAQPRTASGSFGDLTWTASSMLTGATNTGAPTLSGDALFHPGFPNAAYSGVVGLLVTYTGVGSFVCSGTLMNDRQSILTAAHCVTNGPGLTLPASTTVFFQPTAGVATGNSIYDFGSGATTIAASSYFVNPLYNGDVINQNDIAVIRMSTVAPATAASYGFRTTSPEGLNFNVAGYGNLGAGATGSIALTTGRLRQGNNLYDFRLGNALFGTNWATVLGEPFAQIENSFLSDFDNSLAANDTACRVTQASIFGGVPGTTFCNLGLGNREVGIAGGDSGGPNFISGLVAGVNSYGLSFGTDFGDVSAALNSSFGEFSGYVPTHIHTAFITASLVPEPGTYAMLALGLVAVAGVARRRKA